MFFKCHSVYKTHIIMTVKLTYHGGQIIYVIYIYIYYGVTTVFANLIKASIFFLVHQSSLDYHARSGFDIFFKIQQSRHQILGSAAFSVTLLLSSMEVKSLDLGEGGCCSGDLVMVDLSDQIRFFSIRSFFLVLGAIIVCG
jgi:hypothetical protein